MDIPQPEVQACAACPQQPRSDHQFHKVRLAVHCSCILVPCRWTRIKIRLESSLTYIPSYFSRTTLRTRPISVVTAGGVPFMANTTLARLFILLFLYPLTTCNATFSQGGQCRGPGTNGAVSKVALGLLMEPSPRISPASLPHRTRRSSQ